MENNSDNLNPTDKSRKSSGKDKDAHLRKRGRAAKSYYDQPIQKILRGSEQLNFHEKKEILKPEEPIRNIQAELNQAKEVEIVSTPQSVDLMDLPQNYGETALTLIAQDPYCVYAYWEISGSSMDEVKARMGSKFDGATYTMRVFDVTFVEFNGYNANYWFDLDELHMNERYINVWSDNATFCAEMGMRTQQGEFFPITRSNYATTPRANFSNRYDMIWKEISEEESESPVYVNVKLLNRQKRGKLKPRSNWQVNTSRISLSRDDIMSYYRNNQALIKQIHIIKSRKKSGLESISDLDRIQVEKSIIPALMKSQSFQKGMLGSSDLHIKEKRDDFYFEIQMELTVTGRVQPGGEVILGNQKVLLNEDGTFTLRFPLEDGQLPFNFLAYAKEKGLGKKINTSVLRTKTEKNP